jgi:Spy/CpxP family protein refolding chaperone
MMTLVICLAAVGSAWAQGQGGRRGGGGGMGQMGRLQLLGTEQVQIELKLSDDQIAKIKTIADANRPQRDQGGNNQRPTDEERAERRKKAEAASTDAVALLNNDQKERLEQIRIWAEGYRALSNDDEVAKKLNLTDDQKGALKAIADDANTKRSQITQGMRGANEETRKKITEDLATLNTNAEKECLAVLTDAQKSDFDKLRGTKFTLDRAAFGGGRGRRGGNANNN